jgi:L-threonylcarbamoyladenylate synthase
VRHAAQVLRHSGLVAFPTDTVYGVGAMVFVASAVERLYTIKGRSTDKAIAVLVGRVEDLKKVLPIERAQMRLRIVLPSKTGFALDFLPVLPSKTST